MSEPVELVLSEREEGIRLDKVLAERLPDLTRTAIQRLLEEEQVLINGKPAAKNRKGRAGDSVALRIPDPEPLCLQAENVPLDIVYEDDDLLVVNKPQGMVVHPAPGNYQGTLVNALLAHCGNSLSGINGVIRPGIVHRIDKDTSGLLMVAKNDFAHQGLARQIKEHSFRREYEAVVAGRMKQESGVVNAPIGRHPIDRKKMAVTEKNSKEAVTYFRGVYPYPPAAGNRKNPSNSGAYGLFRPSGGGGPGLWAQKAGFGPERAMPSCQADRLCPSERWQIS